MNNNLDENGQLKDGLYLDKYAEILILSGSIITINNVDIDLMKIPIGLYVKIIAAISQGIYIGEL